MRYLTLTATASTLDSHSCNLRLRLDHSERLWPIESSLVKAFEDRFTEFVTNLEEAQLRRIDILRFVASFLFENKIEGKVGLTAFLPRTCVYKRFVELEKLQYLLELENV